jgi:hypothetical protein
LTPEEALRRILKAKQTGAPELNLSDLLTGLTSLQSLDIS